MSEALDIRRDQQDNRHQWATEQIAQRRPIHNRNSGGEDSWIEISSQPSTSSLSTQNYNEIVTTGLDLRSGGRPLRLDHVIPSSGARSTSVAGSSQDEYEESESESERVMSSSNEEINPKTEDEDEIATTLGIGSRNIFTPQPNAFSHPPQSNNSRSTPIPNSYFPAVPAVSSQSDRLPGTRTGPQLTTTPRSIRREPLLPSRVQPDHDAALRASLTTLLSCAAAVRPPREDKDRERIQSIRPSIQLTTLRLVPESELGQPRPPKTTTKRRSRESSKERHAKKIRAVKASAANEEVLSPTVMTWMISAGVVLFFSAISFSAGYAWGKEVGRVEGELGIASGSCGREALKAGEGLRKLRWSAASHSARA